MKITGIIWLEDIVEKLRRKHGVREHEVTEVLNNRPQFFFIEKGHRKKEDVYLALGRTDAGRPLAVFFIYKQSKQALIVSAREMTSPERKRDERK